MTCLIIDDDVLSREITKHLISETEDLILIGEYHSSEEAVQFLKNNQIDIIFLDIEMPGMNGFDFLKSLPLRPLIIIVSGHEKYAIQGFQFNVVDYLVKPVQHNRFQDSVKRVREILESQKLKATFKNRNVLFVKDNSVLQKVNFSEIQWIEAQGDYAKLHTAERFYMVHTTLKSLENKLPAGMFIRVHRSFIVALDQIERIEENLIHINKKAIPVSDKYWNVLKDQLHLI